ncbi:MAG: aminoglycoside phosphotransferase family protein [Verrucomicrobia bacterium]|nr:aminoglycoside phosphotransferase family protein [Verrucomicrobiota bacterium]MBS0637525.1 aminoglycoside phosphotransferase family protein [Verrucomicrobiota bacterium]
MVEFKKEPEKWDKSQPEEFYLQMKKDKSTGEITISASKKGVVTWLKANVFARDSYKLANIASVVGRAQVTLTSGQVDSLLGKINKYQQSRKFQKLSTLHQAAVQRLPRALLPTSEVDRIIKKYLNSPAFRISLDAAFVSKEPKEFPVIEKKPYLEELPTPKEGEDSIAVLKPFVANRLGIKEENFSVEPVKGGLTTGLTGVPVYLIKDKNGVLLGVLKQYQSEGLYRAEEQNNGLIARFQGEAYSVPDHLAAAHAQGTHWILQSAAKGSSVSSYFESVGKEGGFEQLQKGIVASAEGLASLHAASRIPVADLESNARREQRIEYIKGAFELGADVAIGLHPLNRQFLQQLKGIDLNSMDGCLTHGDFQPGNVFIDRNNNFHPTFIDLDTVSDAVDEVGQKFVGFPAYDLANFSLWIAVEGHRNGLSQEQIQGLRHDFEDAYLQKMNLSGVDREKFDRQLLYMRAYICMERLPQIQPGGQFHSQLGSDLSRAISSILLGELEQLQGGPTVESKPELIDRIQHAVANHIKVM